MDDYLPSYGHVQRYSRRAFLHTVGRRTVGVAAVGVGLPAALAACATDEQPTAETAAQSTPTAPPDADAPDAPTGTAIVGDVLDFALRSDAWVGAFGFVTFRLHEAVYDGSPLYFIRTDSSDGDYAGEQGLVTVPKIAALAGTDHVVHAYFPADGDDEQPAIVSSEPGLDDYSPAWQIARFTWVGEPRPLTSVADVEDAEAAGDLEIEDTEIILNASAVKWSTGELPADTDDRSEYLGPGQLLEPPDTDAMEVMFKLHECFPASWYIVTDTDLAPMAEGMAVVHSPALEGSSDLDATGRTNVFMNGIDGSGPMGFQPSVFDTQAGDPEWSPYWDHMTYAWEDGVDPRVLASEDEVHAARDAGELEEFPGVPDTEGEIFVVNCPVPVIADNTFEA